MSSLTTPIFVQAGKFDIDQSVVPALRSKAVVFSAHDLKPYIAANAWFDDVSVTQFVQPASTLTTNTGTYSNAIAPGTGLYNNVSHAYCTVIDTSLPNTIYINENYLSINLTPFGPALSNTFSASSYKPGDIVYQANNSQNAAANTFMGQVAYWNYVDGSLALQVTSGFIANTVGNCILYKVGAPVTATGGIANVVNTVTGSAQSTGNWPLTSQVVNTANISNLFLVAGYQSNHGVLVVSQNILSQNLVVNGCPPLNIVGNTVYITSGDGIGQFRTITAVTNSVLTMNASLTTNVVTSAGHQMAVGYAIGRPTVDAVGRVCGVFNIPEDQNKNWSTGNRLFTLNDGQSAIDQGATMRATAIFAAAGSIAPSSTSAQTPIVSKSPTLTAAGNSTVVQQGSATAGSVSDTYGANDPQSTPDPLAQTFTVPTPNTAKADNGIFCTSVDLFFQAAPVGSSIAFPVTVRLATVENGFPTTTILAQSTVDCAEVNVTPGYIALSNTSVYPDSTNTATITKFSFPDPVYLAPGTEYAIVVYTESPDYHLWVANTGEPQVNSTAIVQQGNYVGNFYQAQNSSAWNPIPGQMLMFVLNKAQFSTQPTTLTFQAKNQKQNTYMDMALLHSSDLTFPVANINYSMLTTIANTGAVDSGGFFAIQPNLLYNFGSDLKSSSILSNRRRMIIAGNTASAQVNATLYTSDPDISPMFNAERFSVLAVTNLINNGSIDPGDISITSGGHHSNAANITVTISAPTGQFPIQATANVLASQLTANLVTGINILNPGAGYVVAPTITLSEPVASSNATAVITGENAQYGGNGETRYLTKQITLAPGFAAGDLQVFVDCIRPQGTDIQVYYKVMSGTDTDLFTNKVWQQMNKAQNLFSQDQTTQITLTYNTGSTGKLSYIQNGISYPLGGSFQYFAIKIVLFANDPTVPPLVQDFRAVCVPAG